jgi:predicted dehydrogenase
MHDAHETAARRARFQVPHAFDNVERMLDELPEIDVVCVSVRPAVHHQVVMAALNARKHVYCEHPLGITTSQAQDMHDLAQRNGVRTVVGHEYHYEPAALRMAELVRQGYLGKPLASTSLILSATISRRGRRTGCGCFNRTWRTPGYRSGHSLERVTGILGRTSPRFAPTWQCRCRSAPT